jgi:hypothetical protein
MKSRHLRRLLAGVALVALVPVVASCGLGSQGTVSPSAVASVAPSSAPAASQSAPPSREPRCAVATKTFNPPTDQLVSMEITTGAQQDQVVLRFGPDSGQPVTPHGRLRADRPPFTEMGSGAAVTVKGKHFVELRFTGMYLFDSYGNDAFQGALDRHPKGKALRDVISIDSFEGHLTWIMGYIGGGCVTLHSSRATHTVTIDFEVR